MEFNEIRFFSNGALGYGAPVEDISLANSSYFEMIQHLKKIFFKFLTGKYYMLKNDHSDLKCIFKAFDDIWRTYDSPCIKSSLPFFQGMCL